MNISGFVELRVDDAQVERLGMGAVGTRNLRRWAGRGPASDDRTGFYWLPESNLYVHANRTVLRFSIMSSSHHALDVTLF